MTFGSPKTFPNAIHFGKLTFIHTIASVDKSILGQNHTAMPCRAKDTCPIGQKTVETVAHLKAKDLL